MMIECWEFTLECDKFNCFHMMMMIAFKTSSFVNISQPSATHFLSFFKKTTETAFVKQLCQQKHFLTLNLVANPHFQCTSWKKFSEWNQQPKQSSIEHKLVFKILDCVTPILSSLFWLLNVKFYKRLNKLCKPKAVRMSFAYLSFLLHFSDRYEVVKPVEYCANMQRRFTRSKNHSLRWHFHREAFHCQYIRSSGSVINESGKDSIVSIFHAISLP